jgi:hypothetical protein
MTGPRRATDRHHPRALTSTDRAPTTANAALGNGRPTHREERDAN